MSVEIASLLTTQRQLLATLNDLIAQEKQALSQQQAETLLQVAEQKRQLLMQLQQHDEQLAQHSDHQLLNTEFASEVEEIKHALAQCQQANEANAKLIELNLASINRLASALQVSRNASSLTYDGKGKTSTISTLGNNLKV